MTHSAARPARARLKWKWLLWTVASVLLVLVVSLAQGFLAVPKFMRSSAAKFVYAPKSGRVTDAKGQGIPDVTLVVTGYYSRELNRASILNKLVFTVFPVSTNGGRNVLYSVTIKTDGQGNFAIANMHDEAEEAVRDQGGGFISYTLTADWDLDLIKFGYVAEVNGHLPSAKHAVVVDDGPIEIGPLQMRIANADLADFNQEISAYVDALRTLSPPRGPDRERDNHGIVSDATSLAKQAYAYFTARICALGPKNTIEITSFQALLIESRNQDRVMKALNPDWWDAMHMPRDLSEAQYDQRMNEIKKRGNLNKHSYDAGDVCMAMSDLTHSGSQ